MSEDVITKYELTDLFISCGRHALGLPNSSNKSYRNRFVGPTGDKLLMFREAERMGFCTSRKGSELTGGDTTFFLTLRGATLCLNGGETLCREDFPKQ